MTTSGLHRDHLVAMLFPAILAACLWAYSPGLGGFFTFDDHRNLEPLAYGGGIDGIQDALSFALSRKADLIGRPLSMLTFAAHSPVWPTDPWVFKYTNLMLHLLTGSLVCLLALRLARFPDATRDRAPLVAIAVAALWMLHPLNVSTVLYVTQRMTILATLFIVLGILLYIHGRACVRARPLAGYLYMSAGIGGCGLLAILSKENGALIVLYALVVEYTLLRPFGCDAPRGWRLWASAFLFAPILYGIHVALGQVSAGYDTRPFTLTERVMTESRALASYAGKIVSPRPSELGIFHDDFAISRGLLAPPATLACIVAITLALAAAFIIRGRRWQVIQFAILWFFAGHLLESTVVPLELYFEHRNYLPMVGPLFAAAYYIVVAPPRARWMGAAGVLLLVVLFGVMTRQESTVWGDRALAAAVWPAESPDSARALQFAAGYHSEAGDTRAATTTLRHAVERNPLHAELRLQLLQLTCLPDGPEPPAINELTRDLRAARIGEDMMDPLLRIRAARAAGRCPALDDRYLQRVIDALATNPSFRISGIVMSNLLFLKATLHADDLRFAPAVEALERALAYRATTDIRMYQAELLASAGWYEEALEAVSHARRRDARRWRIDGLRAGELDDLEARILRLQESDRPAP